MPEPRTINRNAKYKLAVKVGEDSFSSSLDLLQASWIPLDAKSLLALEKKGAKTFVPPLFYDNDLYNRISLEIYDSLLGAFAECDEFLGNVGASRYRNLVAVFFQEILRILCAYYFKRYEVEFLSPCADSDALESKNIGPLRSPYVDYDFVLRPDAVVMPELFKSRGHFVDFRGVARAVLNFSRKIRLPVSGKKKRSLLCAAISRPDILQIEKTLNEMSEDASWDVRSQRQGNTKIEIPYFDEQFRVLLSHLSVLANALEMSLPEGITQVIRYRVASYIGKRNGRLRKPDALLVGSLINPETRVVAARYKSMGVPVVSVFHGGACGLYNEPVIGYGENTFTDVVIGYGDAGCALASDGNYLKSLFGDPVVYIPSTSAEAERLYEQVSPNRLSDVESPRFMYVPTSFIENGRYGPYRDMHDAAYMRWQKGLMSYAGELYPGKVVWKPHVKERTGIVPPRISGVKVLTGISFEDVIEEADVFIFDYVSTAFTLAAATSKPVIYLDIGLRNITDSIMRDIRARCIYVRADPQEPRIAFQQALELAGKQCVNRYTTNVSLAKDRRPRHEVIAETLLKIMNDETI